MHRLITVSEAYQHSLSKKKISDALTDGEKLLPVDTFGIVMILHGEEFGEDSTFGASKYTGRKNLALTYDRGRAGEAWTCPLQGSNSARGLCAHVQRYLPHFSGTFSR